MDKTKRRKVKKLARRDNLNIRPCNRCCVCGTPLVERGGFAGVGMCGPCATGDASTAGEY